jgi:hypothetical protein
MRTVFTHWRTPKRKLNQHFGAAIDTIKNFNLAAQDAADVMTDG